MELFAERCAIYSENPCCFGNISTRLAHDDLDQGLLYLPNDKLIEFRRRLAVQIVEDDERRIRVLAGSGFDEGPQRVRHDARGAYRPIHHCIVVVTSSRASCCTK